MKVQILIFLLKIFYVVIIIPGILSICLHVLMYLTLFHHILIIVPSSCTEWYVEYTNLYMIAYYTSIHHQLYILYIGITLTVHVHVYTNKENLCKYVHNNVISCAMLWLQNNKYLLTNFMLLCLNSHIYIQICLE